MAIIGIIVVGQLLLLLYWVGGVFYAIRKGFNEVIKGLESVDQRLSDLQEKK